MENIVSNDFCKKKIVFYDIYEKLKVEQYITLPYADNAQFAVEDLVNYFRTQELSYMIIGASQVTLANHPKPESLDVWIRKHENVSAYANTCQAVNNVVNQLTKHEAFALGIRNCPTSNRMCKALVFCDKIKFSTNFWDDSFF